MSLSLPNLSGATKFWPVLVVVGGLAVVGGMRGGMVPKPHVTMPQISFGERPQVKVVPVAPKPVEAPVVVQAPPPPMPAPAPVVVAPAPAPKAAPPAAKPHHKVKHAAAPVATAPAPMPLSAPAQAPAEHGGLDCKGFIFWQHCDPA